MVREALDRQIGGERAAPPPTPEPENVIDESLKKVITETDIRSLPEGATLQIHENAIMTPSASDLIRERSIKVKMRSLRAGDGKRIIALGADHGGFEMKESLKKLLAELGYAARDFGAFSTEAVDYPDFAHAVAQAVAEAACDLGIILDGAGIGSCMVANKVPGVRAAMCYDAATARNSREHNYANVLTLGAKMITEEKMREIVKVWLATPLGEARHGKRVAKITAIEKQYLR
jgi:ribose 5-phosphate isomerase B